MESIFFTFQLGFVVLIVLWAMKNDQAGDDDSQQGLFAVRPGLPAEPREQGRRASHRKQHGQGSKKPHQK